MTAGIPVTEEFHALPRIHALIVMHKDAENNASLTTTLDPFPASSSATPSEDPQDSTSIVIPLPETPPTVFDHLVKWLSMPNLPSRRSNADSHSEMEELTIPELAQLYILAVKLRLTTLANVVGTCLVEMQIDPPTMKDLISFINNETAPKSDLRQFLITGLIRYGTPEAFQEALIQDWMTKEVASDVTLALVRERDIVMKLLQESQPLVAEAGTEGEGTEAVERGGGAPGSKKRGAAEEATAPSGKKRKT